MFVLCVATVTKTGNFPMYGKSYPCWHLTAFGFFSFHLFRFLMSKYLRCWIYFSTSFLSTTYFLLNVSIASSFMSSGRAGIPLMRMIATFLKTLHFLQTVPMFCIFKSLLTQTLIMKLAHIGKLPLIRNFLLDYVYTTPDRSENGAKK